MMRNKKTKLFLCVSLIVVAIYLIAVIISIFMAYYDVKAYYANDSALASMGFTFGLAICLFVEFAVLGNALSCIRSVYKMLKYEPYGSVKILYTVSSILAFAAFALACISALGWIDYVDTNGYDHSSTVLIASEWPIFIVSFILGCIPIKSKTAIHDATPANDRGGFGGSHLFPFRNKD